MSLPNPTTFDVFEALRSFLLDVLPAGTEVVKGQVNRVPEPAALDFVVMWELRRPRLATNVDTWADAVFTGSVTGETLTVTEIAQGAVTVGRRLFGVDVAENTIIAAATGDPMVFTLSIEQELSSRKLAAGAIEHMQETEFVHQLDVHGPNSADNAQVISTPFRDDYACEAFALAGISPLYTDDPRMVPFQNGEQQIETRWVVDTHLQVDPVIATPQQFMDEAEIGLIEVDATYPA